MAHNTDQKQASWMKKFSKKGNALPATRTLREIEEDITRVSAEAGQLQFHARGIEKTLKELNGRLEAFFNELKGARAYWAQQQKMDTQSAPGPETPPKELHLKSTMPVP